MFAPQTIIQQEFRVNRGFYPTPEWIVEIMLQHADIQPEHSILEPSAGSGNIADVIRRYYPDNRLACVERSLTLAQLLKAKRHLVYYQDFLNHKTTYDRIVANPPFERYLDMKHLVHMYKLLNPGGRIVSILCDYAWDMLYEWNGQPNMFKIKFVSWFVKVGGKRVSLPERAFSASERPTPVPVCLVIIDKERTTT